MNFSKNVEEWVKQTDDFSGDISVEGQGDTGSPETRTHFQPKVTKQKQMIRTKK